MDDDFTLTGARKSVTLYTRLLYNMVRRKKPPHEYTTYTHTHTGCRSHTEHSTEMMSELKRFAGVAFVEKCSKLTDDKQPSQKWTNKSDWFYFSSPFTCVCVCVFELKHFRRHRMRYGIWCVQNEWSGKAFIHILITMLWQHFQSQWNMPKENVSE